MPINLNQNTQGSSNAKQNKKTGIFTKFWRGIKNLAKRTGSAIKKTANKTWSVLASNVVAIGLAGLGLGLTLATGGIAGPIALGVGASILGVNVAKTAKDAYASKKKLNLKSEHAKALEYHSAFYKQEALLHELAKDDKGQKLINAVAPGLVGRKAIQSNHENIKFLKTDGVTFKVTSNLLDKAVDAANIGSLLANPAAVMHVGKQVINSAKAKGALGIANSTNNVATSATVAPYAGASGQDMIADQDKSLDQIKQTINTARLHAGDDNILAIEEKTRELKAENHALEELAKISQNHDQDLKKFQEIKKQSMHSLIQDSASQKQENIGVLHHAKALKHALTSKEIDMNNKLQQEMNGVKKRLENAQRNSINHPLHVYHKTKNKTKEQIR
ncbi:MAG: hypothetical protein AB8B67_02850 [Rickettsiaceae bacterium]